MSDRTKGMAALSHEQALSLVRQAVDRLRFGVISLTVHDGKIVQVDVTERHRTV